MSSEDIPVIDLKDMLEHRAIEGHPLVIIESGSAAKGLVDALKKVLPDDKKSTVVFVDLKRKPE